jgi:hypothetical protein
LFFLLLVFSFLSASCTMPRIGSSLLLCSFTLFRNWICGSGFENFCFHNHYT